MDRKRSGASRPAKLVLLMILSVGIVAPALGADGNIIVKRDTQPQSATRPPLVPAPNPTVVNVNPSSTVIRALDSYELSDRDFARITSGSSLKEHVLAGTQLTSSTALSNSAQNLPAAGAARSGGGAGSGIAGHIDRGLQRGLAPLRNLAGDR